jgi:hypothetical protein
LHKFVILEGKNVLSNEDWERKKKVIYFPCQLPQVIHTQIKCIMMVGVSTTRDMRRAFDYCVKYAIGGPPPPQGNYPGKPT